MIRIREELHLAVVAEFMTSLRDSDACRVSHLLICICFENGLVLTFSLLGLICVEKNFTIK